MIIITSNELGDKRIVRTLGLVRGSTMSQAGNSRLLAESREQAIQRMVAEAEQMGANAIVGTRFVTSMVMSGAAELLVYGTAVEVE